MMDNQIILNLLSKYNSIKFGHIKFEKLLLGHTKLKHDLGAY